MEHEDRFYKVSEQLNCISGLLESSFKYQIITIAIFVSYLMGDIKKGVKIFDIEFNVDFFILVFPAVLLYLVSRMAYLTMLFIEFSELFFSYLNDELKNLEQHKYYRAFRPQTIFISVVLTRNSLENDETRKGFHYILASVIYMLPGISLALAFYSIFRIPIAWVSGILLPLFLLIYIGMFYEYYWGTYTRQYRYVLYATSVSMVVCSTVLIIIDCYGLK